MSKTEEEAYSEQHGPNKDRKKHGPKPATKPIPVWAKDTAVEWVYRSAAKEGDAATVKRQLELGCAVNCKDVEHHTALMLAAEKGHLECVKAITAAKPDLDLRNAGGMTAAMLACFNGFAECGEVLLAAGSSGRARDNWDQTSMERAVARDYVEVVQVRASPRLRFGTAGTAAAPSN